MPIDGSALARMIAEKPQIAPPRDQLHLPARTPSRSRTSPRPQVLNRPHSITADVEIPDGGAEGVLLSQGTAAGGYSFFIKDGKLRYVHNYVGRELSRRRRPTMPSRPASTSCASSSSRPASRTCSTGKGAPGTAPALRRRHPRRQRRCPGHDALRLQPRRAHLRRQPGLAGHPRVRGPVHASPAPCTASPSTSAAS